MTQLATFTVGGHRFRVEEPDHGPSDGPMLSCDSPALQPLVELLNDAALGLHGNPKEFATGVRNGQGFGIEVSSISPVEPTPGERARAWAAPGAKGELEFARARSLSGSILGAAEWFAVTYEEFSNLRRQHMDRWIFRRLEQWPEPAPGEEALVRDLEARFAALLEAEPERRPTTEYSAWLERFASLQPELDRFGVSTSYTLLDLKRGWLTRFDCSELLHWYTAAADHFLWARSQVRLPRLPVGYDELTGWVSTALFFSGKVPTPETLAAAELEASKLAPGAACGTFVVAGHEVFWRTERGRPVVVSLRVA